MCKHAPKHSWGTSRVALSTQPRRCTNPSSVQFETETCVHAHDCMHSMFSVQLPLAAARSSCCHEARYLQLHLQLDTTINCILNCFTICSKTLNNQHIDNTIPSMLTFSTQLTAHMCMHASALPVGGSISVGRKHHGR